MKATRAAALWLPVLVLAPMAMLVAGPAAAASDRHALVITVGRYANPDIAPLPGTRQDRESARLMARHMDIPPGQISYLSDEQATGDGIRQALRALDQRVAAGDRVYLHFSGHGTRYFDERRQGCVEAFLGHDAGPGAALSNAELADLLRPITRKTDKLFVVYDACHSGGLATAQAPLTRAWTPVQARGGLTPRFGTLDRRCDIPANMRTRNLMVEQADLGALPQDVVHLAAARDNEISFDEENKGGLATQYVRDCLLGGATDLNGSGTVDIDEVRQCAQQKINQRLQSDPHFSAHNLVLQGNPQFVPVWFGQAPGTDTGAAAAPAQPTLSPRDALWELYAQRDGKRSPLVRASSQRLRIGQDRLSLDIGSERSGWVYVWVAGSDRQRMTLVFPNRKDPDNHLRAGEPLHIPRPHWNLAARGPAGTNHLLVMLTAQPMDLSRLAGQASGTYLHLSNDPASRAELGQMLSSRLNAQCARGSDCINGFGAAWLDIVEE